MYKQADGQQQATPSDDAQPSGDNVQDVDYEEVK